MAYEESELDLQFEIGEPTEVTETEREDIRNTEEVVDVHNAVQISRSYSISDIAKNDFNKLAQFSLVESAMVADPKFFGWNGEVEDKCQIPSIGNRVFRDIQSYKFIAEIVQRFSPPRSKKVTEKSVRNEGWTIQIPIGQRSYGQDINNNSQRLFVDNLINATAKPVRKKGKNRHLYSLGNIILYVDMESKVVYIYDGHQRTFTGLIIERALIDAAQTYAHDPKNKVDSEARKTFDAQAKKFWGDIPETCKHMTDPNTFFSSMIVERDICSGYVSQVMNLNTKGDTTNVNAYKVYMYAYNAFKNVIFNHVVDKLGNQVTSSLVMDFALELLAGFGMGHACDIKVTDDKAEAEAEFDHVNNGRKPFDLVDQWQTLLTCSSFVANCERINSQEEAQEKWNELRNTIGIAALPKFLTWTTSLLYPIANVGEFSEKIATIEFNTIRQTYFGGENLNRKTANFIYDIVYTHPKLFILLASISANRNITKQSTPKIPAKMIPMFKEIADMYYMGKGLKRVISRYIGLGDGIIPYRVIVSTYSRLDSVRIYRDNENVRWLTVEQYNNICEAVIERMCNSRYIYPEGAKISQNDKILIPFFKRIFERPYEGICTVGHGENRSAYITKMMLQYAKLTSSQQILKYKTFVDISPNGVDDAVFTNENYLEYMRSPRDPNGNTVKFYQGVHCNDGGTYYIDYNNEDETVKRVCNSNVGFEPWVGSLGNVYMATNSNGGEDKISNSYFARTREFGKTVLNDQATIEKRTRKDVAMTADLFATSKYNLEWFNDMAM